MNTTRILVCLYSDANFLAVNILENLLSKNCQVSVVTDNVSKWNKITGHLSSNTRFAISDVKKVEDYSPFNYSVFCGGFIFKEDAYKSFKKFLANKHLETSKRLAIFPYESFSLKEDLSINPTDNLSIVYIGDLVGPRIDIESDLLITHLINEVLKNRRLTMTVGEVFYPVFVTDAARAITKWLFSFGPYGKEIFLLGPQISATDFWSANRKIVNEIELNYQDKGLPRFIPKNFDVETLPTNLDFALYQTYKWLGQSLAPKQIPVKIKKTYKYPKYFKPILVTLIIILASPFILIIAALAVTYLSYRDFLAGRDGSATGKMLIAQTLFVINHQQSGVFSYIPLAGYVYQETGFISDMGDQLANAAVTAYPLIKTASRTFNSILGDSVYDPTQASEQLTAGINVLNSDVSVMQSKTLNAQRSGVLTAKYILAKIDFDRTKTILSQGETLMTNLPNLLGRSGRKTYLVLFQNNMELRPTGGFIGSFGLLTFDSGRMTDLTVNDVYSADGQLKGHVEPPAPIKDYLGEANWWLRDSNWDPDFPTSAQRAEWFLDKELGTQVDGVFAIDLKTVAELLKVTGPIFLADYNLDITSANLYEKTQSEAQDESFPGSHQKASFLTALSRNLIGEVEKLGDKQKMLVLISFFKDFEERHIQAFLHDDSSQNSISLLGWGGEVAEPSCGQNCYADLVGLTEANLGVNKANFFVTRNAELAVSINRGVITRKLGLMLNNSANPALGLAGTYGVYIRAFVPKDSQVLETKVVTGESEEGLTNSVIETHGRQEVGVFVKVLGGQSKKVEFTWATSGQPNSNLSSYGLYIRKQGGVSDDPWRVTIDTTDPALTKPGVYTYNTVLARDFFLRLAR